MNTTIKSIFVVCLLSLATTSTIAQIGIGTSSPAASAKLEISSTTKGFLPPRMTTTERNAIASPATGLVIFNTTTNSLETRNSTGWASLSETSIGSISNTSNSKGAIISSGVLSLAPADATNGGILTPGAQTIAGAKTFSGNVTSTGGSISGFAAAINNQTGSTYTLSSSDNGKVVTLNNSGGITLTINTGLGDGFNCLIVQKGFGQITITGGSGVTLINRQNQTKTAGRHAVVSIVNIGSESGNEQVIVAGDTGS